MSVILTPLSVNEAWEGRRFKSKKYKQWEREGLWLLKNYKGIRPEKWFKVEIGLFSKSLARRDIDNILKPFFDLLRKAEIIKDDRYCLKIEVEKMNLGGISRDDYLTFELFEIKI